MPELSELQTVVSGYLNAFPKVGDREVLSQIVMPYCYCAGAGITKLSIPAAFLAFRDEYMSRVEDGARSARIISFDAQLVGHTAALAHVKSARLNAKGEELARSLISFILCTTKTGWRVGAVIASARPKDNRISHLKAKTQ